MMHNDDFYAQRKRFDRGFNLTRSLVIGGAVLMVLAIFGGALWSSLGSGQRRDNADAQARAYVRTMHPSWGAAREQCQGEDTDGNGYVTCTVGGTTVDPRTAEDREHTEAIECAAFVSYSFNRGCRPMRYGYGLPTGGAQ